MNATAQSLEHPCSSRLTGGVLEEAAPRPRFEPPTASGSQSPNAAQAIQHILVATDFSASATRAVRFAATLARQCGARLSLLHVVDISPPDAWSHSGSCRTLMTDQWAAAAAKIATLDAELAEHHLAAQTILVEGIPWEEIAHCACGCDLLVMGNPAPRRRWSFFSPKTARRSAGESACPVVQVS